MREREAFEEDLKRIAPDVAQPDLLFKALSAAQAEVPADAGRHQEILSALLGRPARIPLVTAVWREFALLPLPSIGLAAGLSLVMLLFELLAPPIEVRGHALAWIGLAAPWLGMLWGIAVLPARRGAWADWQAIAPLSFALRMVVRLGTLALVSLVVSSFLVVSGTVGALVLSWAGPFVLGAVLMAALAWRFGAVTAVTVSALAWGIPTAIGVMASAGLLHVGSAWAGYVMAEPGTQLPEAAMLALAVLIGAWLVRRGGAWMSN